MGKETKINITAARSLSVILSKAKDLKVSEDSTSRGLRMTIVKAFRIRPLLIAAFLSVIFSLPATASYIPFNTNVNMNIGIGTSTPQSALVVANGNVGIGTWTAAGGNLIVNGGGNVGIGSAWPGVTLDVNGSVRMTGFQLGTSTTSGFVLTTNGSGNGTWQAAGNSSQWITNGSVGIGTYSNVGIGTTTPQGGLVVTNGNVGIGTWAPAGLLDVKGSLQHLYITTSGNVGMGTSLPSSGLSVGTNGASIGSAYNNGTSPPSNGLIVQGNMGIGTWVPQSTLSVGGAGYAGIGISVYAATSNSQAIAAFDPSGNNIIDITPNDNGYNFITSDYTTVSGPYLPLVLSGRENTSDLVLNNGNVGMGTTTPQGGLVVTNGNVGIGTWTAAGGNLIVNGGGNVGIGSAWPGQVLDVNGTVRMTGFQLGTSTTSGYVLTANSSGNGTWQAAGSSSQWITNGSVGIGTYGSVGIGTTTPQGGLVVTNGNVGIGTWVPVGIFQVYKNTFSGVLVIDNNGNLGLGTTTPQAQLVVTQGNVGIGTWSAGGGNLIVNGGGNVGIGTAWPGETLDVNGSIRVTGFQLGTSTTSGFVLTAGSSGTGTWQAAGGSSQWITNGSVGIGTYTNVGIGTTSPQAAFVVTNGNVGIGTWTPSALLQVNGSGVVGIGTTNPTGALEIESGNVGVGTYVQPNALSVKGGISFSGDLGGGTTGNVGIGTAAANAATCDTTCNTAAERCFFGLKTSGTAGLVNIQPCSTSISGTCVCLPQN